MISSIFRVCGNRWLRHCAVWTAILPASCAVQEQGVSKQNPAQKVTSTSQSSQPPRSMKKEEGNIIYSSKFTEAEIAQNRLANKLAQRYIPGLKNILQDPRVMFSLKKTKDMQQTQKELVNSILKSKATRIIHDYNTELPAITLIFFFPTTDGKNKILRVSFETGMPDELYQGDFAEFLAVYLREMMYIRDYFNSQENSLEAPTLDSNEKKINALKAERELLTKIANSDDPDLEQKTIVTLKRLAEKRKSEIELINWGLPIPKAPLWESVDKK